MIVPPLLGLGVIATCVAGVALTVVGLPGTWLMLLAALGAWWAAPGMYDEWTLGVVGVLCILAEVAEGVSGAVGAKAAGSSRRAAAGAIVGGLLGAIFGTVLIPIPVVGTIVGAAVGSGAGAVVMELTKDKPLRRSTSLYAVGKGAAVGRLWATVIKGGFALVIAGMLIVATLA
jgi:uncharacterized protein YqgC (DUF456 family)